MGLNARTAGTAHTARTAHTERTKRQPARASGASFGPSAAKTPTAVRPAEPGSAPTSLSAVWPDDPNAWWRRLCPVTPGLLLCGDLHPDARQAALQLHEWVTQGVTHILDVRSEYSDERTVKAWAPQLTYHWLGTEDHGLRQDPAWFDAGVAMAQSALQREDARLVVHCHMGINRGPSMALAVLLAQGWDCIAALDAIRAARPIAAVLYAADAVAWWHARRGKAGRTSAAADLARVQQWFASQGINPLTVARLVRAVG